MRYRSLRYREEDFEADACTVMTSLGTLNAAVPLDEDELEDEDLDRVPARDPATVFGFACDQTPELMPLPIALAHRLARRLWEASGDLPYLSPDGKVQVGVEYRDGRPVRIHAVTLVAYRSKGLEVTLERLEEDVRQRVLDPVFAGEAVRSDGDTRLAINPEAEIDLGGPAVHSGLTGRKNGMDTYGEFARHGGAALSAKDPSRSDRVGAYAACHATKNVVAAGSESPKTAAGSEEG